MQHVPGDKEVASIFSISWPFGSLAVVVQRVIGVSRTFDARNSAQIFVDRPDVVVSHVLKAGPRHDLQKVAVKWRWKALAVGNACTGWMKVIKIFAGPQDREKLVKSVAPFRPSGFIGRQVAGDDVRKTWD